MAQGARIIRHMVYVDDRLYGDAYTDASENATLNMMTADHLPRMSRGT